jgi:hypothetical protein
MSSVHYAKDCGFRKFDRRHNTTARDGDEVEQQLLLLVGQIQQEVTIRGADDDLDRKSVV